jgi:hypothetical protein
MSRSRMYTYGPVVLSVLLLAGCSAPPRKESRLFPAGEKAAVGPLIYTVVDSQFAQTLGDDPNNQRTPANRFVIVQLSVSNSGNSEMNIPAMTLIDDDGQSYPELADGRGVQDWMGVIRKVATTQTEHGQILFDAPAKHYRLRLTDETDDDISIDIPLSYIHEQLNDSKTSAEPPSGVLEVPKKK